MIFKEKTQLSVAWWTQSITFRNASRNRWTHHFSRRNRGCKASIQVTIQRNELFNHRIIIADFISLFQYRRCNKIWLLPDTTFNRKKYGWRSLKKLLIMIKVILRWKWSIVCWSKIFRNSPHKKDSKKEVSNNSIKAWLKRAKKN